MCSNKSMVKPVKTVDDAQQAVEDSTIGEPAYQ